MRELKYNNKIFGLLSFTLLFTLSCNKYDDDHFNMTVSVPGNSYLLGGELTVEIEGGDKNAVIYPVLVRYTNGTNLDVYPPESSNNNSNVKRFEIDGIDTDQCCAYEGITDNMYSGYNDNLKIGHFCLCEFPKQGSTRTLNFEIEESGYVYWTNTNGGWSNGNTNSMPADQFYGEADFFRVFIVDPFLDEVGNRGEYAESPHPTEANTICMSEQFSIH